MISSIRTRAIIGAAFIRHISGSVQLRGGKRLTAKDYGDSIVALTQAHQQALQAQQQEHQQALQAHQQALQLAQEALSAKNDLLVERVKEIVKLRLEAGTLTGRFIVEQFHYKLGGKKNFDKSLEVKNKSMAAFRTCLRVHIKGVVKDDGKLDTKKLKTCEEEAYKILSQDIHYPATFSIDRNGRITMKQFYKLSREQAQLVKCIATSGLGYNLQFADEDEDAVIGEDE